MSGFLNTPNVEWVLLISAIVLGTVGAVVIGWLRKRQLRLWDLRDSLVAPSMAVHLWTLGICAVVVGVVLSNAIYSADIAPEQKWANVFCWWVGNVIGAAGCLFSLVGANRSYERGR